MQLSDGRSLLFVKIGVSNCVWEECWALGALLLPDRALVIEPCVAEFDKEMPSVVNDVVEQCEMKVVSVLDVDFYAASFALHALDYCSPEAACAFAVSVILHDQSELSQLICASIASLSETLREGAIQLEGKHGKSPGMVHSKRWDVENIVARFTTLIEDTLKLVFAYLMEVGYDPSKVEANGSVEHGALCIIRKTIMGLLRSNKWFLEIAADTCKDVKPDANDIIPKLINLVLETASNMQVFCAIFRNKSPHHPRLLG